MQPIEHEYDACIRRFMTQAQQSNSPQAVALRGVLANQLCLSAEQQALLLHAVADFVQGSDMLEIYGGASLLNNELDEHLQRNTLQIAVVFLELKALFKNRLPPAQWQPFEKCLRAFELYFNDHQVIYRLRRFSTHRDVSVGARYLGQIRRLQELGLHGVAQFDARLKLLPNNLIERFVLFLEAVEDEQLPLSPESEHTTVLQLSTRAWWQQLVEFAEAHHPTL